MSLHSLLPLIALLLNVSLAGISLFRNAGSRLNRVFVYFASGMIVWNLGAFLLRRAPDEAGAYFSELILHAGVIVIPAFYYHFVLIFLERVSERRPSLFLAYALAALFVAINLSGSPLFMKGVTRTYWGWAPATGPLYLPFVLYFNACMVYGLYHLVKAYKGIQSSFRRNRLTLILYATFVSLFGGVVDFARFILARFIPAADQIYPIGIPTNMIFAVMLGISIVRYRMFDVNVVVKKAVVYAVACVVITSVLALLTQTAEWYLNLSDVSVLWIVVPMGIVMTLVLTPLGQRLEGAIERVMFSKRRGCYDTLLELIKGMSTILDFGRLVQTLVQRLARGIPVTHCALLVRDRAANAFVPYAEETTTGEEVEATAIGADSAVARWLKRTGRVLVKEEVQLNPEMASYFEAAEAELEEIKASVIVPLRIEDTLIGILLLGEKLSGEIFDGQELEVLSVLANQAAISLENARLYEELGNSNARLAQANRLKSQFLASMSHELRTPLNSIIGFSRVMLKRVHGELTEQQETYINSVHKSSTHLLGLIDDILDISRIEAGKVEMHPAELDLGDLVDECIESAVALARGKPLKIEKQVPLELPKIHADPMKVKQVLLNLLSNAIKFTAAGRVLVRVEPVGDGIRVSVADTGIGIREDDLPRLFEPFHRLDNPLAQEAGGSGLGLAISKKFIDLHGGRIWVESQEKQGSTFHFTLPLTTVG